MKYKDYFTGKKVAVVGLGPHGEMISDIKFLFKYKADVSVYDPRNERVVQQFFLDLADTALFRYTFGNVPDAELADHDLIILAHDIPRQARFLKKAKEKGVQIEYPTTLFLKLCPPVTLLGIAGPCGKSTIFHMIKDLLDDGFDTDTYSNTSMDDKGREKINLQSLISIDPDQPSIISQLKKTRKDDVVMIRMTDEVFEEMYAMRMSPHVALITGESTGRSTLDVYKIFDYQTYNAFIITTDMVADSLRANMKSPPKAKILRVRPGTVPATWTVSTRGKHDRINYAFAVETARLFKMNDDNIRAVLEAFSPLKQRMEPIKKAGGFEWYNDSYSVSPISTLSAIQSIGLPPNGDRRIVLILGGVFTGEDFTYLLKELPTLVHTVIMLPGSGTLTLRPALLGLKDVKVLQSKDMLDALLLAKENARKGDAIVYSPAFDPGGIYKTKRERSEAFMATLKSL